MNLLGQLIESLDFPTVASKLAKIHKVQTKFEKRYYLIENKVKMVAEFVSIKLKNLEKER